MIRTIKQRIYVGLLPLAILAVALVVFNGVHRIDEANRELQNAQTVTAELLSAAAAEALTVGNTLNFEEIVAAAVRTSPLLVCITLRDAQHRVIAEKGDCAEAASRARYFPIVASVGGLSDFDTSSSGLSVLGELGILMTQTNVIQKRRQVAIQLALSLFLIALVLGLMGRLLRARLIEPIQRIDAAMQALSHRNYDARVQIAGDEEIARLAREVNNTIAKIASYTRELELRRDDADRALQDADEANLAREALVRSLTEDIEGPISRIHSEVAAIAIANHDLELKHRIKGVLEQLQEAQASLVDLIEVASSTRTARRPPMRDLADLVADIRRDIHQLLDAENIPISFALTQTALADAQSGEPTGVFLDLDGVRLRKALAYLIRAMSRQCRAPGVYINMEVIKISADQVNVSVHLKAFYETPMQQPAARWTERLSQYASTPPGILGWTERETRIISYLLRAIGITPTFATSLNGTVNVVLDATCRYMVENARTGVSTDWMLATQPIAATIVSEDVALERIATRGGLSNHEVRLVSFERALSELPELRAEHALLIDVSETAAALRIIERLKTEEGALPPLIAICPPGHISDALGNRLFELGFTGVIQKPIQYSRVLEVLRTALADPLQRLTRDLRLDSPSDGKPK